MSVLIFRLNGVSDEEAADVRELLNDNQLAFYETDAGRWGLSIAALWLKDGDQLRQASYLLTEYQRQRENNAKINNSMLDDSATVIVYQRLSSTTLYSSAHRSRQSGFTLIEIMVVIVILAILAGLVVPKVVGQSDKARIKTTETALATV